MESLFRATELEMRVPLNLNVLDAQGVPRVMSLKEALQAFLDHRRDVLQRRSQLPRRRDRAPHRDPARARSIVYLNLDEVIRIIREEDDPKARMMKRWKLTEVQAEAILNMRLRALRRLEEIAIKKELAELSAEEQGARGAARPTTRRQWTRIGAEIAELAQGIRQLAARQAPHRDRHAAAPRCRCRSRRWSSASR